VHVDGGQSSHLQLIRNGDVFNDATVLISADDHARLLRLYWWLMGSPIAWIQCAGLFHSHIEQPSRLFYTSAFVLLSRMHLFQSCSRHTATEMEPGHESSGHRVIVYARVGSGGVSGQTICVFRPDAVTRFLVEQQIDSLSALFTVIKQ